MYSLFLGRCDMRKIRKNRKRIISIILCCITLVTSLRYAYDNPREVKAVAIVDDIAIILMVAAACGVGWTTYKTMTDGSSAFDLSGLEDAMEESWNKGQIIQFPDQNPDDFDPENDDPEKKPSNWQKFKEWVKLNPKKTITLGGTVLGGIVTYMSGDFLKKRMEGAFKSDEVSLSDDAVAKLISYSSSYPYVVIAKTNTGVQYTMMYNVKPLVYYSGNMLLVGFDSSLYEGEVEGMLCKDGQWSSNVYGYSFSREGLISSNVSVYESYELAKSNYNDGLNYPGRINPASLPLSTDIMDWVGDNPEKEKPDDPFYGEIRLPNQDEM